MNSLMQPMRMGELELANRIVMAPMTRSRADSDAVPTAIMVDYYAQRAAAGLIVAEGTAPSADGLGYCRTPAIYNQQQIDAWRQVTEAVHAAGGQIVLQLMHCGRAASRHNKPESSRTVAPSAVRAEIQLFTDAVGMADTDVPEALSRDDIRQVIADYRQAALNARAAGFDGVELHCTSGYLPMQFMSENANQRTDEYGGSADNRVRFAIEVLQAMAQAIGPGRVGVRFCPGNKFNDIADSDPAATFDALLRGLDGLNLAYLHIMRAHTRKVDAFARARAAFSGPLIVNDGFEPDSAEQMVAEGLADAVSFGRHFIANPDLVRRIDEQLPLAEFDRHTLYSPGPEGYIDYPVADSRSLEELS
ncbi:oxidoreductase [Pseudomonas saudimassiliensis]|uniref:Oxidoreductase n=1 Tax=Pseudomonas saudimassiliensis TaxID=1461581 RepID=A0A078M8V6_9PSED|nr:alkene reductase [Pseudomonas saudimassiliensis]CEA02654.1 oxidoreductase [Pseudomonas saudimassiliensis]CEF25904.1 oxidoreductase [Pseudomonas saudimassiliensis]